MSKKQRAHLKRALRIRIEKLKETFTERFWSRVDKNGPNGCWIWKGELSESGYGRVKRLGEHLSCHRLTFGWMFGAPPKHLLVCHHCDTPACVRPDHLFLGTVQDNVDDCIKKNRRRYHQGEKIWMMGERNCKAKLTDSLVRMIRAKDFENYSAKIFMSRELGISDKSLNNVIARRTWKHIP